LQTELLTADSAGISRAAEIIKAGGLVAMPTETVYGLAADALNPAAVAKIFKAKGRPQDNPLIVHISEFAEWESLTDSLPQNALLLAKCFWPGSLTVILKKSPRGPGIVSAGLDTVAVRLPAHPVARRLIAAAKTPLAAPSANLSGSPSPTKPEHVINDLSGSIEALIDGGDCAVGVESTVLDLTGEVPTLLRPGGVTAEELRETLGRLEISPAVLDRFSGFPPSPGMKYRHYAPKAALTVIHGSREQYISFLCQNAAPGIFALCYSDTLPFTPCPAVSLGDRGDPRQTASRLFTALRELDRAGAQTIYSEAVEPIGFGLAVANRLLRAAGFRRIIL
jgi:L-threonylcarbamoyladenylate synthase